MSASPLRLDQSSHAGYGPVGADMMGVLECDATAVGLIKAQGHNTLRSRWNGHGSIAPCHDSRSAFRLIARCRSARHGAVSSGHINT